MSFKPFPSADRLYGLLLTLILALTTFGLVKLVLSLPVGGLRFMVSLLALGCVALLGYIGYRTFGAFSLSYWVDRNAVTLVWGSTRQVIPLGQIQRIVTGSNTAGSTPPRPWHWPCPHRRRLVNTELGVVNAYATRPLNEQVILVTPGESYGLSPQDAGRFITALQERFALGPARVVFTELQRPPVWTWPLWRDRAAIFLVGAGLLGVLVMFGVLSFRFSHISADIPLHFDVNGMPDRIAAKNNLFALPVIGLVTWVFNTLTGLWLYRRVQRGAAYLLWGGALAVQGVMGLALFILMRW